MPPEGCGQERQIAAERKGLGRLGFLSSYGVVLRCGIRTPERNCTIFGLVMRVERGTRLELATACLEGRYSTN
jgi:hypothetical protein